jgi:hypothetical protein
MPSAAAESKETGEGRDRTFPDKLYSSLREVLISS